MTVSDSVVSLDDFATYLGNPSLDEARAVSVLDMAQKLCESIVKPLPDGADVVVIDVAERAYANPVNVSGVSEFGGGPFDGAPGPAGTGLYLTQENKATLRRLNGSGGAFSIDTTPATAGQGLPWWDTGATSPVNDWDTPS